ncbi:MAG: ROK family glucokinase [Lachnospiraceae bacterium]
MKRYLFGIDVGGTTVKCGLFTVEGTLCKKWQIPTNKEQAGTHILPDIADSIHRCMKEEKLSLDDIQGIGIGVPGPVTVDGIVKGCVNLGWEEFPIADTFSEIMSMPVIAGNDANVATLGEVWQGAAKGNEYAVMVTLGTGVGGGVVYHGHILSGPNGACGEIGHITVNLHEQDSCNCGKKGCLEQYASATGIVKVANRLMINTDTASALRNIQPLTAKAIFDQAKSGDTIAMMAVQELSDYLGIALSHVACVCDPEVILIGGGVSKAGSILTDHISAAYQKYAFHATRNCKFEIAALENDAGIYGAAKLALDSIR